MYTVTCWFHPVCRQEHSLRYTGALFRQQIKTCVCAGLLAKPLYLSAAFDSPASSESSALYTSTVRPSPRGKREHCGVASMHVGDLGTLHYTIINKLRETEVRLRSRIFTPGQTPPRRRSVVAHSEAFGGVEPHLPWTYWGVAGVGATCRSNLIEDFDSSSEQSSTRKESICIQPQVLLPRPPSTCIRHSSGTAPRASQLLRKASVFSSSLSYFFSWYTIVTT